METLVELSPLPRRVGSRRQTYRVTMPATGEIIVDSARDPEHAAARALWEMGVAGTMLTRWAGSTVIAMRLDVMRAARRAVDERRMRIVPRQLPSAWHTPPRHGSELCIAAI